MQALDTSPPHLLLLALFSRGWCRPWIPHLHIYYCSLYSPGAGAGFGYLTSTFTIARFILQGLVPALDTSPPHLLLLALFSRGWCRPWIPRFYIAFYYCSLYSPGAGAGLGYLTSTFTIARFILQGLVPALDTSPPHLLLLALFSRGWCRPWIPRLHIYYCSFYSPGAGAGLGYLASTFTIARFILQGLVPALDTSLPHLLLLALFSRGWCRPWIPHLHIYYCSLYSPGAGAGLGYLASTFTIARFILQGLVPALDTSPPHLLLLALFSRGWCRPWIPRLHIYYCSLYSPGAGAGLGYLASTFTIARFILQGLVQALDTSPPHLLLLALFSRGWCRPWIPRLHIYYCSLYSPGAGAGLGYLTSTFTIARFILQGLVPALDTSLPHLLLLALFSRGWCRPWIPRLHIYYCSLYSPGAGAGLGYLTSTFTIARFILQGLVPALDTSLPHLLLLALFSRGWCRPWIPRLHIYYCLLYSPGAGAGLGYLASTFTIARFILQGLVPALDTSLPHLLLLALFSRGWCRPLDTSPPHLLLLALFSRGWCRLWIPRLHIYYCSLYSPGAGAGLGYLTSTFTIARFILQGLVQALDTSPPHLLLLALFSRGWCRPWIPRLHIYYCSLYSPGAGAGLGYLASTFTIARFILQGLVQDTSLDTSLPHLLLLALFSRGWCRLWIPRFHIYYCSLYSPGAGAGLGYLTSTFTIARFILQGLVQALDTSPPHLLLLTLISRGWCRPWIPLTHLLLLALFSRGWCRPWIPRLHIYYCSLYSPGAGAGLGYLASTFTIAHFILQGLVQALDTSLPHLLLLALF